MKIILLALALTFTGLELWAQPVPTPSPLNPAQRRLPRFANTNGPVTIPRYQPTEPTTSFAAPIAPAPENR